MSRILKLALFTVASAAIAGGMLWSFLAHRAELATEAQSDEPIKGSARVGHSGGETVVRFDRETQQRMGIRTETLVLRTKRREVAAYGRLEEDPSRSFVLRAPVAGAVRGTANRAWPDLGQSLADRSVVGVIDPRLLPAERVTFGDRLKVVEADIEAGKASLAAAQAALDRARMLNADDKNVSDRAVQDAQVRVAAEQAHLTAATESASLIASSLTPADSTATPLELALGGEVVEVLVHPGESVESGQPILRVTRFDRLLARVDVPAGQMIAPGVTAATIVPLGREEHPIRAERVALAASVDPKTQGQPFLFRLSDPSLMLRPGLSLTGYLELPGPARAGVVLPGAAVVWQAGKAWIYVQTGAEQFARRPVVLEEPAGPGWFTSSVRPGDRIVTVGAQTLLSEEFKSQIEVGEESEQ
jgi:biotin carboxyl carrier protein